MSDQQQGRLESWKEIGAYLQRDARTVRRWEKEEGLPVHRHGHKRGSSVYAYPSEIDAWRAGRKVVADAVTRPLWKIPAFAVTMLLCLVMVGNGVRPVAAQQGGSRVARQIWGTGPNEVPYASSPNGRSVAFTDWSTGDLWVRDLPSGANRRLTNYGADGVWWQYVDGDSLVFSHDGGQIAYSWTIDKETTNEVRVVSVAGGTPRTIRRGSSIRDYMVPFGWTPDNKWVLISRNPADNTTQLAMVSVRDGSLRLLKSFGWQDVHASLSPDGRWIAYDAPATDKKRGRDIFVLAVDGSRESAVVQDPADDSLPVWTPDGKRIVFLSDRTGQTSIWSVPVSEGNAGNPELLRPEVGRISWMRVAGDGTLYYNVPGRRTKFNIYSADLSPGGKDFKSPVLAVENFVNHNSSGRVSPDGEYLAYVSVRVGSKPTLIVKRLKTGEESVVPLKPPIEDSFTLVNWFPDGKSVFVGHSGAEGPGIEFYRVDSGSGKADLLHRTHAGIESVQLSPDGKFIVYTEKDTAETAPKITTRLVHFDLETRRETELKKGEWFMGVGVSPDSKQISYLIDAPPALSIAVMPAAGGPAREIYRVSPEGGYFRSNPQVWTPDQRYLILVRQEGQTSSLWRVPVAGGVTERIGISMQARLAISMPADGKRIFLTANEVGPNEVWALENFLPKNRAK